MLNSAEDDHPNQMHVLLVVDTGDGSRNEFHYPDLRAKVEIKGLKNPRECICRMGFPVLADKAICRHPWVELPSLKLRVIQQSHSDEVFGTHDRQRIRRVEEALQ